MKRRYPSIIGAPVAAFVAAMMTATPSQANTVDPFWVTIQVASLPKEIELCRALGPDAVMELNVDANGEYEWDVGIDIDGVASTGSFFGRSGNDVDLTIYATDPDDTLYFQHCGKPFNVPTQTALKAAIANGRPGAQDFSVWNSIPVRVDIDHGTMSVQLDRNSPVLAGLSPRSVFNVSAWGIYQGPCIGSKAPCHGQQYATDFVDPLVFGSALPVSTTDARGDVSKCQPAGDWCNWLDIVGVGLATQATTSNETAAAFAIGPGITGSWYDPNQSGHGLAIEVLPGNNLLAYWFSFNPDGSQQSWFLGVGNYSGNVATISQVDKPQGGRWIPNFDASKVTQQPWGALTFTFSDCNHGRVDFDSTIAGYGSGHMDLTRLTMPAGLSCP